MIRLRGATSEPGLSRATELSIVLGLLDGRPGDLLLDLGGPFRFSTRLLARLGYAAAAVRVDGQRRRMHPDRMHRGRSGAALRADRLPFRDGSFDGIVGVGTLATTGSNPRLLADLCRVLRPGARAVLSETSRGSSSARLQTELWGDEQVASSARRSGFAGVEWIGPAACDHPDVSGPPGTDRYAVLHRDGCRPLTSRRPGLLRGRVNVERLPSRVRPNDGFVLRVTVENTGDTVWLREPCRFGGYVTIDCRLLTTSGLPVEGGTKRHCLPIDLPPGAAARRLIRFKVPPTLAPDVYELVVDLTNEMVCAFSELDPASAFRHNLLVVQP